MRRLLVILGVVAIIVIVYFIINQFVSSYVTYNRFTQNILNDAIKKETGANAT